MEILWKKFVAVRLVLKLGHDLRCSIAERENTIVSNPFVVYQVDLAKYDLVFAHLVSNVHSLLREFADRLSIFGHRFVPIRLMCLLFFGSAINNPSQLYLSHVHFLYDHVGDFQQLYRDVYEFLLLFQLFPFQGSIRVIKVQIFMYMLS